MSTSVFSPSSLVVDVVVMAVCNGVGGGGIADLGFELVVPAVFEIDF